MLSGKKIPLPEESARNIEKSLNEEPLIIGEDDSAHHFDKYFSPVQIGKNAVPKQLKSRCLVVRNNIKIVIEENDDLYFSQRILFFKE